MTPLTRQQVREFIDANITARNARRAPNNQLRTYDQLHAGYSVEEKRDIAAVREEINRTGGTPRRPPTESREAIAKRNLSTLASLLADYYNIDQEVATEILKKIEGWEDRLAECSTAGNPTKLTEINDDLRNFLLENGETLNTLIKEAREGMG